MQLFCGREHRCHKIGQISNDLDPNSEGASTGMRCGSSLATKSEQGRRRVCKFRAQKTWGSAADCTAYSYRRLSTGSSWAARVAGTVPKITPTTEDTMIAMMADRPEIGTRYSVRKRME